MVDFLTVCEKAARLGAATLMAHFGRVKALHKGYADLVTEADHASQEVIRRTVLEAFPDHRFLGEEGSTDASEAVGGDDGRNAYRWIVDPLDGTTNFVHQMPHFSVSIALEHGGEPIVACVYNPVSGECFTAVAGEGARLDGRPIRPSRVTALSEALASAGFPPMPSRDAPDVLLFLAGLNACQAIRRTGSAALNMSYVACGRFDVAWSFCTKIWDVAAGSLLIREAGGTIASPDGGDFIMETGQFLAAANRPLLEQLIQLAARAIV
jgi:myo-inositol-1(or 4)-monophosphatase